MDKAVTDTMIMVHRYTDFHMGHSHRLSSDYGYDCDEMTFCDYGHSHGPSVTTRQSQLSRGGKKSLFH